MEVRGWLGAMAVGASLVAGGCGDDEQPATTGGGGTAQEQPSDRMILASTTSTQDSGLFEELMPAFQEKSGITVQVIAVGSGQAIEMGRRGEADAVLAHSPAAERELMDSGVAGERQLVMHNDFVIIGPEDDPAGIEGDTAAEAMRGIAEEEATFVSRADDSGTHAKELGLWEQAGVEPQGDWYIETGQGMGATLAIAAERDAYALADRGTYLSNEQADSLPVMVDGGEGLLNIYHVIDIEPSAGRRVNAEAGDAFAEWVVSDEAQEIIASFGEAQYGRPLFNPDAGRSVEELDPTAA